MIIFIGECAVVSFISEFVVVSFIGYLSNQRKP